MRLVEQGYTGGITILREYVRKFRPPRVSPTAPARTMRFETQLGEQAQMDWVLFTTELESVKAKAACLLCHDIGSE